MKFVRIVAQAGCVVLLMCVNAFGCTIYGLYPQKQTKYDNYNNLNEVLMVTLYMDAKLLSFEQIKSAAKYMAPIFGEKGGAAQVELYFQDGTPKPNTVEHIAYFAYTPDQRRLTFRDELWEGNIINKFSEEHMVFVTSKLMRDVVAKDLCQF